MSTITPDDVYKGLWVNWSKGRVLGSTITVSATSGVIIAAFVAIFVNLAVGHLWHLIAYAVHQSRMSNKICHPMLRQQQVILKNQTAPISAANKLLQLMWAWPRRNQRGAFWSTLVLTLLSVFCSVAGIVAGIFSSYIIDTTNIEVLVQGKACGFWIESSVQLNESLASNWEDESNAFYQQGVVESISYAKSCYNASSLRECNTYTQPTIDWTTNWQAECPFEGMCIGDAMQMDTGMINTNDVFGLNYPANEQFEFRRVTTCAPIVSEGYIEVVNSTVIPGDQIQLLNYGPTVEGPQIKRNETWDSSAYAANLTKEYTLGAILAYAGEPLGSQFLPVTPLNLSYSDITLMFVGSNGVRNVWPIDDPIFAAHRVGPLAFHGNIYYADNITTTVGCAESYQFCNTNSPTNSTEKQCTALAGMGEVYSTSQQLLSLNPIQNVTMEILYHLVRFWGSSILVNAMSSPPNLLLQDNLQQHIQEQIPANQWQIEVSNWHATALANIQGRLVQRAVGPNRPAGRQFVSTPSTDAEASVCASQRVRIAAGYSNISTFGMAFVLSLGLTVTIISTFLNNIASLCARCLPRSAGEKQKGWLRDDALHLQRLAYQGQVDDLWEQTGKEVPIMSPEAKLGPLGEEDFPLRIMRKEMRDSLRDVDVDSLMGVEEVEPVNSDGGGMSEERRDEKKGAVDVLYEERRSETSRSV